MTEILEKEIKAFEKMKPELIKHHLGKFVVIYNEKLIGVYDNFNKAAEEAIQKYGKGPYLIREVVIDGSVKIPASIAYRISQCH